MRTKNSVLNMAAAILSQAIIALLGILTRRVFIQTLSVEYLGCNGFFNNILQILTLVGCGASAISYIVLRALATEDKAEIRKAANANRIYCWVSTLLIAAAGLACTPFVPMLLKNSTTFEWSFLKNVFLLFLLDMCLGYWSGMSSTPGYYDCVIKQGQKAYLCSAVECGAKIVVEIMRIVMLILLHNYYVYLVLGIIIKVVYIIGTRWICYHTFPYLREPCRVDWNYIKEIHLFREIGSNFAITVAIVVFSGTDNILITYFLGLTITGLYSNYALFYNQLLGIVSQIINGISAPVGNYINSAETSPSDIRILFYVVQRIVLMLGSFCAVFFWTLCRPFITIFFGDGLLLSTGMLAVESCLFYLSMAGIALSFFRHPVGNYWLDQNYQIAAAAVNLALSLLLVRPFGVTGVLIGTIIGTCFQIAGYAKVVFSRVITECSAWEWWLLSLKWFGFTMLCGGLGYLLVGNLPYTWGYVFVRIAVVGGILCVGYGMAWCVSKDVRAAVMYIVRKLLGGKIKAWQEKKS